ncbi:MAG: CPBP family intramembrane metalloprotease [Candidatus Omnitrophica bacterium]|nr:CPBP family intramembrane metalloprotease [Candidatus Omnitrophota bacterium]
MTKKIKLFIFLSIIFVLGAFAVQMATHHIAGMPQEDIPTLPDISENFMDAPYFRLVFFVYFILFTGGIGIAAFWIIQALRKQKVFPQAPGTTTLHYDHQYNLKIITLITATTFLATLAILGIAVFGPDNNWPRITIFYNIFLEISVFFILARYIPFSELGIRKDHFIPFKAAGLYAITVWLIFPAAFVNHFIASSLHLKSGLNPAIPLYFMLKDDPARYLLILQIVVLGPIVEELFFRGFLYGWLRKRMSFIATTILVSLIFSLIHRTYNVVLPLFILSFMLCFLYERTHNMVNSIFFHSLHNLMGCIVLFALNQASSL